MHPRPAAIALAGLVSLAVAMGIGRFAFTPILPMMLHDRTVDLAQASWLASANYIGYLLGALLCTFQPWFAARLGRTGPVNAGRLVRIGLAVTVLLTLAMAAPLPALWPTLRFAAGVTSAVVFVYTTTWCLGRLARLQLPAMGALIYTGPGAGIALGGLAASAMVALDWRATQAWAAFGVLAAMLTALVFRTYGAPEDATPASAANAAAAPTTTTAPHHGATEVALLSTAYGLAGFGYIITATFLPVIARQTLTASPWLDLFWPIFGASVVVGAIVASRMRVAGDLRVPLVGCFVIQAAGVAASLVSPTLPGFAVGSILLGLPFTAITFFAMQEIRRIKPAHAPSYMGLATATYGLGQIVGPPLAAGLVARSATAAAGFSQALWIAAGALGLGALLFALLTKWYPARPASQN
ncbi:YbfB/YjiJ family MFS transporter [Ramlibacter sp.]|uniref:YbfB/YjiJ family MFS transporter n=1 Tax=Ramlibacter sp. TaxID=1917967 RepID=UPI003D11334B